MRIGIVGCGYVADYYVECLKAYPQLKLVGVADRDQGRAKRFSVHYSTHQYSSLEELLGDKDIDIVLNLTNPASHFSVSRSCLEAGKHVYSEKPLATNLSEARELVDLAQQRNLYIVSAPCSILGETAQTLWKGLRNNLIGRVRLVYADLDDGPIHRMACRKWRSKSGTPWPYENEFDVGCILEHAAYYITWFVAFFGPVQTVSTFTSCLWPDKITGLSSFKGSDFSVACITFASGIVVRLTCSTIASRNRSLSIFGDSGTLATDDVWCYKSPVYLDRGITFHSQWRDCPSGFPLWERLRRIRRGERPWSIQRYPLVRSDKFNLKCATMDYLRGVAEFALAISQRRPPRLSAQYSFHVNEVVLAIHNAAGASCTYKVLSSCDPVEPMPWAI